MRWLAKLIYFKIIGWKVQGTFNAEIKKCVFIVAPHTSWHDFFMGLLIRRILDLEINYIAKKELFKPSFGWYFKWMGGAPLDRTPNQNKVEAIAQLFDEREVFRLALSPEGTRKKVERFKTGFYYISLEAKVPIILVAFDYGKKTIRFSEPFYPSGDIEKDMPFIMNFYKGVKGKVPENF
ncbi:1-acyl-sn-glycerol-3-phosphate acyltransferase [Gillisia sp. M10.2A]|uniref:1-acyl-sn-glycerol-3-phosphate acyltransferase n=1 Tax=Gillisia lutea TaxID=2909668 RepID=A0ABS9EFP9_9FLAO|nr:1-acyl-sn-glycerol-3-phosphate acyltransferase [Gillisia lutea]MCF4101705.1 1-acyl-sn-glycerol-3-phosphate acyltransferase [Gillisia lutea]